MVAITKIAIDVSIIRIVRGFKREYLSGSWLAITNSQMINPKKASHSMIRKILIGFQNNTNTSRLS